MNAKKAILIIGILMLTSFFIVLKFAFLDWNDDTIRKGKASIKSSTGDEFLLEYTTKNFPDYETSIYITDIGKRNKIVSYVVDGDFVKPDLKVLIDNANLKCYEVDVCIIYRVKQGIFRGINKNLIENAEISESSDLIPVAKALASKKDWKWIKACGRFLIKSGDNDMKKTLERYSAGQFTPEELEQNNGGEINKDDMQAFAKQVLGQQ